MNRLVLATASKLAASAHWAKHASASSSARLVAARQFSDSSNFAAGTVKHFGIKGGYGFIVPDGVDPKKHTDDQLIFIHRNDITVVRNEDGSMPYFPK